MIPHLRRCQGFAVVYYGVALGRLGSGASSTFAQLGFKIKFDYFSVFVASFHILVAIGISFRTSWGFKLLKGYLYVLQIAFPLGQ